MRYFFIEKPIISNTRTLITGSDEKHIRKVLRLKPGDMIGLYDGKGFEYHAEIASFSPSGVEVSILNQRPAPPESPVKIVIAQGFLKERKMDELVRQLTELGVSKWIPFMAARTVPKPGKQQLLKRMERWEKISKQAIKQCERGLFLDIGETLSFEEALKAAHTCDLKIVFWEEEPSPLNDRMGSLADKAIRSIFIMIGPEGGLTEQEIEHAKASGFVIAGMGPRILRAETATVSACVLMQYLFGDMGKKS